MQVHVVLFVALWLAACGYALARGGLPERIIAIVFIAGAVLSAAAERGGSDALQTLDTGILLVDGGMLVVIVSVALRSTRYWPVLMASGQGAQLLAHFAKLAGTEVIPVAYFVLLVALSFPMLGLLAVGTWRHRRRLKEYGIDYAWVWQLPLEYRRGGLCDEAGPGRLRYPPHRTAARRDGSPAGDSRRTGQWRAGD